MPPHRPASAAPPAPEPLDLKTLAFPLLFPAFPFVPGAPHAPVQPPIRDLQFLLYELLDAVPTLQALPAHAEIDADTINAVIEEGGKFAPR